MSKKYNSLIVVPMKNPNNSKSRLSDTLTREARKRLAILLFRNTIDVLINSLKLSEKNFDIAVITNSDQISEIAKKKDILVIEDDTDPVLSRSITIASNWAKFNSYESMCVIPADLADPKIKDIISFISYPLPERGLVITPSIDLGTNALHVSPVNLIKFQYGKKSSLKHINSAKNVGVTPIMLPFDSLRFDVDTSYDLKELLAINPDLAERVKI